jgi:hypothetical protein
MVQSAFVSGAQDHAGSLAGLKCFLPTRCTEAPTVAGFQAAKAEFWHRCRKIVATGFGKLEKRGGHDGANRVATDVLSPSVAAAVSKEARHGVYRAEFKPVTEHVTGCVRPTGSITAVVPQQLLSPSAVSPTDCSPSCRRLCAPVKIFGNRYPCCTHARLLSYASDSDDVKFRVFLANLECSLKFGRIAPTL